MLGRTLAIEKNMELKINHEEKKYFDFTMKVEKKLEILEVIKEIVVEEDIILFCFNDNFVTTYLFITEAQKNEIVAELKNMGVKFYTPEIIKKEVVARELQLEKEDYYKGYTLVIMKEEI